MTGGVYDNSPKNITPPISLELHAALHKDLYEHFGKSQDLMAYKMLLGCSKSEVYTSPEYQAALSVQKKAFRHTTETRKRMSISRMGNRHGLGYRHTEEARDKISKAHKGNTNALGYKHSAEALIKISKASMGNTFNLGRKHSEGTRIEMTLSRLKYPFGTYQPQFATVKGY
jgi:hypothetical protein